jgi:hypothetical protein
MTSTVSAAGLMEPRHRYARTAGCWTPDLIRMPLDGLPKAVERGGEARVGTTPAGTTVVPP